MAIDYPALAQVAVDLITDNGREIQLLTSGASPVATPWKPGAEVARTLHAIQVELVGFAGTSDTGKRPDAQGVTTIQREYLVAHQTGLLLIPGKRIQDGSIVFAIILARQIKPADVTMYWQIQVST